MLAPYMFVIPLERGATFIFSLLLYKINIIWIMHLTLTWYTHNLRHCLSLARDTYCFMYTIYWGFQHVLRFSTSIPHWQISQLGSCVQQDPFECVLETVNRQPSVRRIWIDVSTALLQTNVADYVTLNVHMNGVPQTVLSAYSGHLHVLTVGNEIFPAIFLDKKCYAVMADRKKVSTMQEVGIPVSAVGQGGKAGPQPSTFSDPVTH